MKFVSICAALLVALVSAGGVSAETLKVAVQGAEVGLDPFTKQPIVTITLKPESTAAFGEFTRARIGEAVKFRLGETVLSEPNIHEPIMGGTLVINGQMTLEAARDLATAIMKAGGTFEVDGSDK